MNGWHCPPDPGFEIRALVVPSQARYLSVREALHNIEFNKKYLVSLKPGWQRAQGTKPAISDFLNENEMNRALGHFCTHTGYIEPGEPLENGEMSEMTLPSIYRTRNSNPGGLWPSTLPLGHGGSPQYWILRVDGEKTFLFLSKRRDRETNPELLRKRQRC